MTTNPTSDDRLLSAEEVGNWLGVPSSYIKRWGRDQKNGFPSSISLTNKTIRWSERAVSEWWKGVQDEQRNQLVDYAEETEANVNESAQAQEPPRPTRLKNELRGGDEDADWPETEDPCGDP